MKLKEVRLLATVISVSQALVTETQQQHRIFSRNLWHQIIQDMKRLVHFNFTFRNCNSIQNKYVQDSFVVGSDEEDEDVDGEDSHSDCTVISNNVSTDLDEITIAPIRSNKRKSDEIKQSKVKKRLRIIEMSSDSD